MKKIIDTFKEYLIITIGTAIIAGAVFFFMMPSHLSVGSISGLAIVIGNFIPLPVSSITMFFNVALLVIGFLFIGKEFGVKTVYTSILLPLILGLLEHLFPNMESIMQDPLQDMICYIFFVSIGLAILFTRNASSGGLDIVAKLLNKYLRMDMGMAMSVSGMVVAVSAIFVYDIKLVLLSVIGTYLNGIVVDHFVFGFNIKKRVCILSDQLEPIREFIIHDLHSGATIYQATGAYNKETKDEIITIVDKIEYLKLMKFIESIDQEAFVSVYDVSNVIYRPKPRCGE